MVMIYKDEQNRIGIPCGKDITRKNLKLWFFSIEEVKTVSLRELADDYEEVEYNADRLLDKLTKRERYGFSTPSAVRKMLKGELIEDRVATVKSMEAASDALLDLNSIIKGKKIWRS
jgi:hypothetical protein